MTEAPPDPFMEAHRTLVADIAARVIDAPRVGLTGTLCRAVRKRYLDEPNPQPLYYDGSLRGGRFTPPGGPAGLYLSFDPMTPHAELGDVLMSGGRVTPVLPVDPVVVMSVNVSLRRVLDLTSPDTLVSLGITAADLQGDWRRGQRAFLSRKGPLPLTQLIALAAHVTVTVAAIKYASARAEFGENLVVFPDRLDAAHGDRVTVVDSAGLLSQTLP